jgi:hypothetical protein
MDCNPEGAEPGRCMAGTCVPLKTPECRCLAEGGTGFTQPWKHPNSILIGAFAPLLPDADDCGEDSVSRNYRLAIEQFNREGVGGLPGLNGSRPLALLLCDNTAVRNFPMSYEQQLEYVTRATKHLAVTLEVPAILAYLDTGHLQTVFEQVGKDANVFFMAPHGATNELAALLPDDTGDEGLLWHMLGVPGDVAPAYAKLVTQIDQVLMNATESSDFFPPYTTFDADLEPTRVLLLYSDDPYELQLKDAIQTALADEGITMDAAKFTYLPRKINPGQEASLDAAIDAIGTFKPHIVLSATGLALDYIWYHVHNDKKWFPYYVLSPVNYGMLDQLKYYIWLENKITPGLDRRFIGVNVAGSEDLDVTVPYQQQLHDRFEDGKTKVGENFYDAVYFLAYAMLASGDLEHVYGRDIAKWMYRLNGQADPIPVGETDMNKIFNKLLADKQTFLLEGVSGPSTFNTTNGVRTTTASLYCFEIGPSGASITLRDHVGHYDEKQADEQKKLRLALPYQGINDPPCLKKLNLYDPADTSP